MMSPPMGRRFARVQCRPESAQGSMRIRDCCPVITRNGPENNDLEQGPHPMQASRDIARLIEIMAAFRTPSTGCPWDLEQNFSTIAPYTLEEAYEVADAITRGDLTDLREELGDLLLQVVFHARMAQEQGAFDFGDVVQAITEKLLRRHPHVFGEARGLSPDDVKLLWDRIKSEEKAGKKAGRQAAAPAGALAGVPVGLPALTRALKLQQKA